MVLVVRVRSVLQFECGVPVFSSLYSCIHSGWRVSLVEEPFRVVSLFVVFGGTCPGGRVAAVVYPDSIPQDSILGPSSP